MQREETGAFRLDRQLRSGNLACFEIQDGSVNPLASLRRRIGANVEGNFPSPSRNRPTRKNRCQPSLHREILLRMGREISARGGLRHSVRNGMLATRPVSVEMN